jgi:hypothetical protein
MRETLPCVQGSVRLSSCPPPLPGDDTGVLLVAGSGGETAAEDGLTAGRPGSETDVLLFGVADASTS